MNEWMRLLPHVLPCQECRKHADIFVRAHPPEKDACLLEWLRKFQAEIAARKLRSASPRGRRAATWTALLAFCALLLAVVGYLCVSHRRPSFTQRLF